MTPAQICIAHVSVPFSITAVNMPVSSTTRILHKVLCISEEAEGEKATDPPGATAGGAGSEWPLVAPARETCRYLAPDADTPRPWPRHGGERGHAAAPRCGPAGAGRLA